MVEQEEGILSRWSRLKSERRPRSETEHEKAPGGAQSDSLAARTPSDAAVTPDAAKDGSGDQDGESGGVETIREEDLPDIDTLTYESDFTVFLREGVPAALRNRALAKLWRSDPVLANVDGLNDYDIDYTIKEFQLIAKESAEDLVRGKKRESAHDLRRAERERSRHPREEAAPAQPQQGGERREAEESEEIVMAHRGASGAAPEKTSRQQDVKE